MKRSQINQILKESVEFLQKSPFYLPEWATWGLAEWKKNKARCTEIFEANLGWDVTEGASDFDSSGMVLFTIRNGQQHSGNGIPNKPYCEKIIIMKLGQVCPYHHHVQKTEDIINRSAADLSFHIFKKGEKDRECSVQIDGVSRMVGPKENIILHSGQSLTLPPYYVHSFRPSSEKMLIGEVSSVNDDSRDNIFEDNEVRRFPEIEEDAEPLYAIVGDYRRFGFC